MKYYYTTLCVILILIFLTACGGEGTNPPQTTGVSDMDSIGEELTGEPVDAESLTVDIMVTWEDNSDNEEEFLVLRRSGFDEEYTIVSYLPVDTTAYIDEDLPRGTAYCYAIVASNEAGSSSSSEACISL
jgi:outer membrane lipoprotein-sorting protein